MTLSTPTAREARVLADPLFGILIVLILLLLLVLPEKENENDYEKENDLEWWNLHSVQVGLETA